MCRHPARQDIPLSHTPVSDYLAILCIDKVTVSSDNSLGICGFLQFFYGADKLRYGIAYSQLIIHYLHIIPA